MQSTFKIFFIKDEINRFVALFHVGMSLCSGKFT